MNKSELIHPYMYLPKDTSLKTAVTNRKTDPVGKEMYRELQDFLQDDLTGQPFEPGSIFPGREPLSAKHNNPDYTVCAAVQSRILRLAFFGMITGEERYKKRLMEEFKCLFDSRRWPEWRDKSHTAHPADLRTGMLSWSASIAYDWLYEQLETDERGFILRGLREKGITPYLQSLPQNPFWTTVLNNWLTVVVGGMGITGYALLQELEEAEELFSFSIPKMEEYLSIYGPQGEFNESPAYAGANISVVRYFAAAFPERLSSYPFPQTCRWVLHTTLPPGRPLPFGDGHPEAPAKISYIGAVAGASRNGTLQKFYLDHRKSCDNPIEFLWYDPSVSVKNPKETEPSGIFFRHHGKCVISRSNWNDPDPVIVYGKAGIEENHQHMDIGEVCMDAGENRLLIDIGSPSMYPADFFGENRYRYYNAGTEGHNVPQIGNDEQNQTGKTAILEDNAGHAGTVSWKLDLTQVYPKANSVVRHVVHIKPDILMVLDAIDPGEESAVKIPWQLIRKPEMLSDQNPGSFKMTHSGRILHGQIETDAESYKFEVKRHSYHSPFDKGRLGDPLSQRHEPFFLTTTDGPCRILSVFAVSTKPEKAAGFMRVGKLSYAIKRPEGGRVKVRVEGDSLVLRKDW